MNIKIPSGTAGASPALPESSLWRSRGYIPHFDKPHLIQSITFRLHDAVPKTLIKRWMEELAWLEKISGGDPHQIAIRKRIEKYEDSGYGACWLRNEHVAAMVQQTILHFDGERYRIIAWCIMPNHVHVMIETRESCPLANILHSWKSYSGHEANKLLHRSGKFWFREYHDRFTRDGEHFAAAIEYIENNPFKAGLIGAKEEWRWSSVRERRH